MRLIDADDLAEKAYWHGEHPDVSNPFAEGVDAVDMSDIDNATTIDAFPVVRCRDCKHHRVKNEHERQYLVEDILICTNPDVTDDCWNAVWPDHFCSYGVTVQEVKND